MSDIYYTWQIQMLHIVWTFRHFDPNFVLWFSCYSIESIDKAIEIDIIFQNLTYFEVNCIHFQKSWKIKTVPNAAWLHGPKEKTKGEEYDVGFFFFFKIIFLNFGSNNNLRAESETVKECLNGKRNLINDSR